MWLTYRSLAVNVIAIYSRSRRKKRKPDSITTVEPLVARLYSLDELLELRRNLLRYARTFPPGEERNQHLQIAVRLRALFKSEQWRRDDVRNDSLHAAKPQTITRSRPNKIKVSPNSRRGFLLFLGLDSKGAGQKEQ